MAVCGDLQFWNNRNDVILNPILVVEVLSPSTAKYDQGTKVHYYRSVSSIQHILLVSQDQRLIDHYSRTDVHTWTVRRYSGDEDVIKLLGTELAMEEVYRGILPAL